LGNFDRIGLATKVFGTPVEASVKRIADVLTAWGYSSDLSRIKERSSRIDLAGSPECASITRPATAPSVAGVGD
jgi:hypothetical protein